MSEFSYNCTDEVRPVGDKHRVARMFINKPHARDWIVDMHELTQYPYAVQLIVYPCIIECVHAYCRAIFCSEGLVLPFSDVYSTLICM